MIYEITSIERVFVISCKILKSAFLLCPLFAKQWRVISHWLTKHIMPVSPEAEYQIYANGRKQKKMFEIFSTTVKLLHIQVIIMPYLFQGV